MIKNPTQHKLKEAEFHLRLAKEHYQEDDEFSYFLSAFLSAARSITFYMQKQYAKESGFPEWYCIERIKMMADEDLSYLDKARDEDVHKKPVPRGATRAVTIGIDAIIGGNTEPTVPEETNDDGSVTLNRYFVGREDSEVIEFCSAQLSKLSALVARCEAQCPNKAN